MNILYFYKMNNFLNKYFGFSLPVSKVIVAKCLKLIWTHLGIISGTYFSPFQGVYYLYRGLRRALKPYFGLILEFWIIFLFFFWMNNSIEYSGLYWMNNFLNKYFGFSFPTLKKVVAKCLKLIWNHSGIISGAYFSPFQGVYYLYRGLRRAPKPYFGLILEYWIIFLIFYEWIILLNILDSIEWIIFWMNILIQFWIEYWIESFFWPDST